MKNKCRICGSAFFVKSNYPDIHFNNKVFEYYKCSNCKSFNVFPVPTDSDFKKMYGQYDHRYLKQITGKLKYDYNYHFGNHQGYQLKFLNKIKENINGKLLLDYACGSGYYMKYAELLGAKVVGVEFDDDFVNLLNNKTDLDIYTFDMLKKEFKNVKFDFVHLGHVLEHLVNPYDLLKQLLKFANEDTVFLIDGPLEKNNCLSRFYIDFGSFLKAKKYNEFVPQHLTLTNFKSQLLLFDKLGMKKEEYIIVEQFFPLSYKFTKSITSNISYVVSLISILLSKIIPKSGNIFHYRGRLIEK